MGLVVPLSFFSSNGLNPPTLENYSSEPPAVYAVATLPDGRIVIGGEFTKVNGKVRKSLAFFDKRGNLLPAVVDLENKVGGVVQSYPGRVHMIRQQADGKLLICGNISYVNNVLRKGVFRLNDDFTVDTSFNIFLSEFVEVHCMAVQPDGKILIGAGSSVDTVYRVTSTGAMEGTGTFMPIPITRALSVELQSSGKFIVGATQQSSTGAVIDLLRRFNSTGYQDFTFNQVFPSFPNFVESGLKPSVDHIEILSDDSMLISGNFTTVGMGVETAIAPLVAKLDADGNHVPFTKPPALYDGFFEPSNSDICYTYKEKYIVGGIAYFPRSIVLSDAFRFGNVRPAIGTSICFVTNDIQTSASGSGVVEGTEYFVYDYPFANNSNHFQISAKNRLIDSSATPIAVKDPIMGLTMCVTQPHTLLSSGFSAILLGSRGTGINMFSSNTLPNPLESAYITGTVYVPFLYSGYKPYSFKLRRTTTGSLVGITQKNNYMNICTYMEVANTNFIFADSKMKRITRIKEVNGKYVIGGNFNFCFDEVNVIRNATVLQSTDTAKNITRLLTTGVRDNSFKLNLSSTDDRGKNAVMDIQKTANNEIIVGGGFRQDRPNLAKITESGQFMR